MKAFMEYAKAHQEIMLSLHIEEEKANSYYSIGSTDHYTTQAPDEELEVIETGPSLLMKAIGKLGHESLVSSDPDPFIIGLSVLGEEKWVPNQRMAAFLLCITKYKSKLET